ncbi:tetratricopeptide repeat protein [candidate division WOR-3 bacterium]|nr:tetratricopeptide repeat protein [candidate division WOR-3 bacterium]
MNKIGKEYLDDLTGLYNRRYLYIEAPRKIEEIQERDTPLSMVLIDLDHFKNVNDTYGHRRGDVVLREFGIFLNSLLRADDTVFRYGGDEFVCILPNANYEQAKMISRRFVERCRIKEFAQLRLTMSIGIASCPENARDWTGLFEIADRNLYSAKRHGRDRVGVFEKEKMGLNIPTQEMIGRDEELIRIKGFIQPIFDGCGGAVCISGEVGVGKTRLIQEIVKDPDFQDIQFLNSNLSATTKAIPYYPFREIIRCVINNIDRKSFNQIPEAYQIELVKIVPELSGKSKIDEHIYMVDKFRLFEGVRRFLALQASKAPLFVCLDNIHWADHSSLELFHYLVRTLKKNPIFFFFVYRVEEAKHSSFQNVLQLMAREGLYKKTDIEPLKTADVARMLSLMIDGIPSSELTEYIFKETGGNPFFIEELMKSLDTNGAFIWEEDKYVFDKGKKVVIPYSVEGVVDRKLGMMNKEACDLLEYAAVVGREFDFAFLRDITRMNEGHLFDLMDEILGMKLLKESKGEQYCFSEDIIRGILYQRINKIKLRRYHQVVGEKLLSFHKDRIEEVVEELSHHFYLSGDKEKTLEYSMIAANRAKDAYANQDAIRFYTWVIESLPESKVNEKEIKEIEYLRNRSNVLHLIGENEEAVADLEKALRKAKEIANKKFEADCLIKICSIYGESGQYKDILKKANLALDIYQKMNDSEGEAKTLNSIGNFHWYLGEYSKALEFYKRSLKITKEIGNRRSAEKSLNNIGVIYDDLGEYSKALGFYKRSLKITKEIDDRKGESRSLNNIGIIHWDFGEYSKALEFFQNSLKIDEEIGNRNGVAKSLNNIGAIYNDLGEHSKALGFYGRSLKITEKIGDRNREAQNLNNIGSIYQYISGYQKALEFYQRSLKIREEIGDRKGEGQSLISIGDIFLETKDFSSAKKYYRRAHSIARKIKSKPFIANVCLSITLLYLENNNLVEAKKKLKQISSILDKFSSKDIKAKTLCLSGCLYTKQKKWEKAKSFFKESISIFEKLRKKLNLAQVYYYQGLMFKESGDKAEAKKSFAKAMKIFKKLGAKGWIEKMIQGLGDKETRRT